MCKDCILKRNTVNGAYCILRHISVEYMPIQDCPDYDNDNI